MPITEYVWDTVHDSYLMELDGSGATKAVYTNEPVRYGRVISQHRDGQTSYYHYDGQDSTRQLTGVICPVRAFPSGFAPSFRGFETSWAS